MELDMLQRRIQDEVNRTMTTLEKKKIRPLQKDTYLKMANCFSNNDASSDEIQRCIQAAGAPAEHIQAVVQNEMNNFQNRLSRCQASCQDEVIDKFGRNEQSDSKGAEKLLISCLNRCVDQQIAILPNIRSNLEKEIDKILKK